jgi:hypothetical protein
MRAPRALRPAGASELLEALAARRAAVTSLRGRARVRAGLSGLWVREALLVRRPDAVRIDVLSPFGLALAAGVQGRLLWAYPPAEGTRYEGLATPENLTRFLGAPIAVGDIVDVLLGGPPARAPVAPPTVASTREGEYRLTVPIAGGTQTIWFAGDTLLVARAEETEDDRVALQVAFEDYRDGFPRELQVAAAGGAAARLTYDAVELNAPVDPAVFAPPPAPRVLPLAAVPAPEPP